MSKAKEAQTLILTNNKLKTLPLDFTIRFEELKVLNIDNNNLIEFPLVLCNLNKLEKLSLETNNITTIPPDIKLLKFTLKKLNISNNELIELPLEIGELNLLQKLEMHNNKINKLPPTMSNMTNLTELSLFGNSIVSPPPFIYNKGVVHILRYLREVQQSITQCTPEIEYIWSRKITITMSEAKNKLKRNPSVKILTRSQSITSEHKSSKAINAQLKKIGNNTTTNLFRDEQQDSDNTSILNLNQSQLLYYLTDYHTCEAQGRRDYMEDRCIAISRLQQKIPTDMLNEVVNLFSKIGYFGVYDGHGGSLCAEYLLKHLHKNICNQPSFAKGDFENAIKTGFSMTDENFIKKCMEHGLIDGSTALVVLLIDDKIVTAHCGDSRAVLSRDKKAIRLTEDHKPDRVDELARIEELGGEVVFRGNCFRVMGDLAMSRSFGDLRLKKPNPYVISDPEIRVEELTPKDEFIILASDGLWDVLTDQRAVDIVRKCSNVEEASKKLVETALALGTMDNTTVIVIKLDWSLDFITQDELEGTNAPSVSSSTSKLHKNNTNNVTITTNDDNNNNNNKKEDTQELTSFRNSLEPTEVIARHIYPQVKSEQAIKLKVLIPHIEATKLMKFEVTTSLNEILHAITLKHRFDEKDIFELYKKQGSEDIIVSKDKTLQDYQFDNMDSLEIRKLGTNPVAELDSPQVDNNVYDELLTAEKPTTSHRETTLYTVPLPLNDTENNGIKDSDTDTV